MLTEKRHEILLEAVNRRGSVRLNELCQLLQSSESTVRRDLSLLAEKGLLTKVRGGAMALNEHPWNIILMKNHCCMYRKRMRLPNMRLVW